MSFKTPKYRKTAVLILAITLHLLRDGQSTQFCGIKTPKTTKSAGVTKDFSPLKGLQLSTKSNGYTYTLNMCGVSSQKCPDDPDEVTEGMATQTQQSVVSSRCYILSQWDSTAVWKNSKDTVTLEFGNGSPADCPEGLPRTFTATFTCDPNVHITKDDYSKASFTVKNNLCQYDYTIPTCIACDAGCGSSSSFGAVFFMIFLIASAVYIICGFLINILHFKLIVSEAFPNRAFWAYFIGLVQDGVAFTFMVITCRQQQTQYDSFGSTSKGENVYTNADLSSSGNPYDDAGNDQTL